MCYSALRPLLFTLPPESAHSLTLAALSLYGGLAKNRLRRKTVAQAEQSIALAGLNFPAPLGIAAGFDKDARAILGLAALGVSHVEVGTLTLRPQSGNPRPRIFRLPEHQAVINRMGFPNAGVDQALPRIIAAKRACPWLIVGVNIGKNKDTPLDQAAQDYCALIEKVAQHCDYVSVNISSPNTPGLRELQSKEYLSKLLGAIDAKRKQLRPQLPIFIKIAPDLDDDQLSDTIAAISAAKMDAVIATNTTLARDTVTGHRYADQQGGLSGAVLHSRSLDIVRKIRKLDQNLPIIAAGGIDSIETARACLQAGASLLQAYTGLIYQGPGLFARVNKALAAQISQTR